MDKLTIGVDIGGTRTKIGLVDLKSGTVIKTIIAPTETKSENLFLEVIGNAIDSFKQIAASANQNIAGIGIGIPGFTFANGTVDSTYGFLDFMEDYPVVDIVQQRFSLLCKIDNDARTVALGEALYGAARDYSRALTLTLGTGLGVGFTINQKLSEPLPYAHMAGHMKITCNKIICYCGKNGCLESLVSATGICNLAAYREWNDKYPDLNLDTKTLFREYRRGNLAAVEIITEVYGYLRTGIGNYINTYAPDVIVLGGGVAKAMAEDTGKLLENELLGPYKSYQTIITTSQLEEKSGVLGSAALLINSEHGY